MQETRRALIECHHSLTANRPLIATAMRLSATYRLDDDNRTHYSELRESGEPENAPPRPVLRTRVRTNGRNTRRIEALMC